MKEIELTKGYVAIVDDEDYERVNQYKWTLNKQKHTSYAKTRIDNKVIYMHRLIMNEPNMKVDHIDCNGLNNQKDNLRLATNSQNSSNKSGLNKNNTSGYRGVRWRKDRNKWSAEITYNKQKIALGHYTDIKEAARAYNAKARELFGEFCGKLNDV